VPPLGEAPAALPGDSPDALEQLAALRAREERLGEQQRELAEKAAELARSSRSKAEFLANMSHELRTPLNSLLILSKLLVDNPEGNLTPKQVTFARTIHSSGNDLSKLINDILDLAKLESGTLIAEPCEITLTNLRAHVEQSFADVARQKALDFSVKIQDSVPESIVTDAKRLHQIVKSLLSNAFRFTERGHVSLVITLASYGWTRDNERLNRSESVIAFSVSDSGVGIPDEQQNVIFEAFAHAGGMPKRRLGATGLGLSIARELAKLLGGELRVVSVPGSGSTFTLYLPSYFQPGQEPGRYAALEPTDPHGSRSGVAALATPPARDGDSAVLANDDRVLLALELEPELTRSLLAWSSASGFTRVTSAAALADVAVIAKLDPAGILLDLQPAGLDRWVVLERLAQDPATRHIPVAVLAAPEHGRRARRVGAVAVIDPAAASGELEGALRDLEFFGRGRARRLLLVCTDPRECHDAAGLLGGEGVELSLVSTAQEIREVLAGPRFHAAVVSLAGPEALACLDALLAGAGQLPLIVYAGRALSPEQKRALRQRAAACNLTTVESEERLLQQACIHMHRPSSMLSPAQHRLLAPAAERVPELAGIRILLIDDDVRNVFAMTSALERHGASVAYADNGKAGLELMDTAPDIAAVLVDIVLPDMDGYQVIREIRQRARGEFLPVIAVTAKAMSADRDRCFQAGATHYIAKPLDARDLISALRVAAIH
jgi:signal transduction histidine kinase/CheY-like chemotaxis protein